MRPRIYADTSVIGGCLDDEFREPSSRLLELFRVGKAVLVLSDLTVIELDEAPPRVRAVVDQVPESHREYLELTEEAAELAGRYLSAGGLEPSTLVDAQHIAIATVARVDVVVSWNVRHIVNLARIQGYNSVNLRYRYPALEIRSPQEVIPYEA